MSSILVSLREGCLFDDFIRCWVTYKFCRWESCPITSGMGPVNWLPCKSLYRSTFTVSDTINVSSKRPSVGRTNNETNSESSPITSGMGPVN